MSHGHFKPTPNGKTRPPSLSRKWLRVWLLTSVAGLAATVTASGLALFGVTGSEWLAAIGILIGTWGLVAAGLTPRELTALIRTLPKRQYRRQLRRVAPSATVSDRGGKVWRIRAANESDAMAALGFAMACGRSYQMDIARRRASGRLAALLGPRARASDATAKQLGIADAVGTAADALSDADRRLFARFADGVNAAPRSLEHRLLNRTMERWEIEDCAAAILSVWWSLSGDHDGPAMRKTMAAALPEGLCRFLLSGQNRFATRIDGSPFDDPDIEVPFADIRKVLDIIATLPSRPLVTNAIQTASSVAAVPYRDGSVLINDLHLPLDPGAAPMLADIRWPGGQLSGVALPGVPFIPVGTNGQIAWGAANLCIETRGPDSWRALRRDAVSGQLWHLAAATTLDAAQATLSSYTGPPLAFGLLHAEGGKAFAASGSGVGADDPGPTSPSMVVTANNRYTDRDPAGGLSNFRGAFRAFRLSHLARSLRGADRDVIVADLTSDVDASLLEPYRAAALKAMTKHPENAILVDAKERLETWDGTAGIHSRGLDLVLELRATILEGSLAPLLAPCLALDPDFSYLWFNVDAVACALLHEGADAAAPPPFHSWDTFICAATAAALARVKSHCAMDRTWGEANALTLGPWVPSASRRLARLLSFDRLAQPGTHDTVYVSAPDYGIAARLVAWNNNGRIDADISCPFATRMHPLSPDMDKALVDWIGRRNWSLTDKRAD